MPVGKIYGNGMRSFANGAINYSADTIKCALLTESHTPNQDTHTYASDLTNELSGGGYARQALSAKTVTYDGPTNQLKLTAADVTF